jgi:hypothetical protein
MKINIKSINSSYNLDIFSSIFCLLAVLFLSKHHCVDFLIWITCAEEVDYTTE